MYFLIFQPKDLPHLCLNFNQSQPINAYKRYAYIKKSASAFHFYVYFAVVVFC